MCRVLIPFWYGSNILALLYSTICNNMQPYATICNNMQQIANVTFFKSHKIYKIVSVNIFEGMFSLSSSFVSSLPFLTRIYEASFSHLYCWSRHDGVINLQLLCTFENSWANYDSYFHFLIFSAVRINLKKLLKIFSLPKS